MNVASKTDFYGGNGNSTPIFCPLSVSGDKQPTGRTVSADAFAESIRRPKLLPLFENWGRFWHLCVHAVIMADLRMAV